VFQGVDSLFMDNNSCTFFINKDKTGFYVFSMRDGLTPEVKWARGVQDMDPRNFEARYAALVHYVGDCVNGYKIESGLYAKFGTNLLGVQEYCVVVVNGSTTGSIISKLYS
jgi:hypothetical protein